MVFVAAETGFAAATTNPFTVNIAQGIAELPLNSEIPFRLVFFACAMAVVLVYLFSDSGLLALAPTYGTSSTGSASSTAFENSEKRRQLSG